MDGRGKPHRPLWALSGLACSPWHSPLPPAAPHISGRKNARLQRLCAPFCSSAPTQPEEKPGDTNLCATFRILAPDLQMSSIYSQCSAHFRRRGISSAHSLSFVTLFWGRMKADTTLIQLQGPDGLCSAVAAEPGSPRTPSKPSGQQAEAGVSCCRPWRHRLLGW